MNGRTRRWSVTAGTAAVAALAVSGCQFQGLYNVALPGEKAVSGHVYHVKAIFSDVMDLVPGSSVRVNGVPVGSVGAITLTPTYQAQVVLNLPDSVHLPCNSTALLTQTSLLGEKYIAVGPTSGIPPQGNLATCGRTITDGNTSEDATVEEVFSALSALLNGGGVEQLQTINQELTQTLHGREASVRNLLTQFNTLVGNLDANKSQIVRALDSLNRLAGVLAVQKQTLATALTDLGPGLQVLSEQRPELVQVLQALSRLGQIGDQVIQASQQNTVADLSSLKPTLTELAAAGSNLPHALELALDYPFPKDAQRAIPSDYTNLSVTINLQSFLRLLSGANPNQPSSSSKSSTGSHSTTTTTTTTPTLPTLPSLPPVLGGVGKTLSGVTGSVGKTLGGTTGTTATNGSSSPVSGLGSILEGALQ